MPLPWYTWSRIARKQWWDVLNGTTWMPSRTRRINCRDSGSTKYENRPSFFESHASFARTVRLKSRADVIMRQDIVVWNLFTASATARRPFSPFFFFFPFFFYLKKETVARAFHRYSTTTTTTRHLLKRACAH